MSVLFVTVGTTSIFNREIGTVGGRDNSALRGDVQRYEENPRQRLIWGRLYGRLIEEHLLYWTKDDGYKEDKRHFLQSAAELTSTWCLLRTATTEQREELKRIVLLATATPEGGNAAAVIHAVMVAEEYNIGHPKPEIVLDQVKGLDTEFNVMHEHLLAAVDRWKDGNLLFNLTGGFKATGIIVGLFAQDRKFRLYYQHEERGTGIYLNEEGEVGTADRIFWKGGR